MQIMNEVLDLTQLGRRRRCSNDSHTWKRRRDGTERCTTCNDRFPCSNTERCYHVDCWIRRLQLGIVRHYPIANAVRGMVIMNGPRVIMDTEPEDPLDWTMPDKNTKLEDVL
jgi:hypothetical protein